MVATGAINSNAFSLFLNSRDSPTGSLLFGGVNRAKYHGPLYTIPVEMNPGYTYTMQWIVTVTGLSLTLPPSTNTSSPLPIPFVSNRADPYLLDSGTYNTQLPLSLLEPIFAALGAEYDPPSNYAMVPCSLATNASTLNFIFSSFSIAIPLAELIFPSAFLAYDSYAPTLADGTPACLLGLAPGGEDFILGDTFLRSAYVVFDAVNNEISLAQAAVGPAASAADDIVEIGKGKNAVPGAIRVSNPTRAWANETAIANYVLPATGTWPFYTEVTETVSATVAPLNVGSTGVAPVGSATGTGTVTAVGASTTVVGSAGGLRVRIGALGFALGAWVVGWGVWMLV